MGRGEADWSGMYLSSRSDPFRSDHSLGVVSFGVVGLISSLPSCAFPPVVLLSHPAFLCPPCVYHTHYLIVLPHLTSPQLVGSAGVLSHTLLACILPTDI